MFSHDVLKALSHYCDRKYIPDFTAARKCSMREIIELINSKTIRLTVSDKGGKFVVIPRQLYVKITEEHLTYVTLYRIPSEKRISKF